MAEKPESPPLLEKTSIGKTSETVSIKTAPKPGEKPDKTMDRYHSLPSASTSFVENREDANQEPRSFDFGDGIEMSAITITTTTTVTIEEAQSQEPGDFGITTVITAGEATPPESQEPVADFVMSAEDWARFKRWAAPLGSFWSPAAPYQGGNEGSSHGVLSSVGNYFRKAECPLNFLRSKHAEKEKETGGQVSVPGSQQWRFFAALRYTLGTAGYNFLVKNKEFMNPTITAIEALRMMGTNWFLTNERTGKRYDLEVLKGNVGAHMRMIRYHSEYFKEVGAFKPKEKVVLRRLDKILTAYDAVVKNLEGGVVFGTPDWVLLELIRGVDMVLELLGDEYWVDPEMAVMGLGVEWETAKKAVMAKIMA